MFAGHRLRGWTSLFGCCGVVQEERSSLGRVLEVNFLEMSAGIQ